MAGSKAHLLTEWGRMLTAADAAPLLSGPKDEFCPKSRPSLLSLLAHDTIIWGHIEFAPQTPLTVDEKVINKFHAKRILDARSGPSGGPPFPTPLLITNDPS